MALKYIGSKRKLVDRIMGLINHAEGVSRVLDMFSGVAHVSRAFKKDGYTVTTNDLASYSRVLSKTYVEADANCVDTNVIAEKLLHLSSLEPVDGYVTQTFCRDSLYFQPFNGQRIDAIRAEIDVIAENEIEHAILLTSLLEAADRVDSTVGLQMAYLKNWSKRSYNKLELRIPELIPGTGAVHQLDANEYARIMPEFDIVYLDPPYNQHSYFSNYHIWETLVRNDEPEVYGKAMKRVDCKTTKSDYNSKVRAWGAFSDLVRTIKAEHLVVSFSNEGFFPINDITALLQERGNVAALVVDQKRYIGSKLGVFNPSGARVGTETHSQNLEYIFVCGNKALEIVKDYKKSEMLQVSSTKR